MPISVRSRRVESLARDIARRTGENMTTAIEQALEERLARLRSRKEQAALAQKLLRIARRCSRRPTLDKRSEDEILGYDERGIPR